MYWEIQISFLTKNDQVFKTFSVRCCRTCDHKIGKQCLPHESFGKIVPLLVLCISCTLGRVLIFVCFVFFSIESQKSPYIFLLCVILFLNCKSVCYHIPKRSHLHRCYYHHSSLITANYFFSCVCVPNLHGNYKVTPKIFSFSVMIILLVHPIKISVKRTILLIKIRKYLNSYNDSQMRAANEYCSYICDRVDSTHEDFRDFQWSLFPGYINISLLSNIFPIIAYNALYLFFHSILFHLKCSLVRAVEILILHPAQFSRFIHHSILC